MSIDYKDLGLIDYKEALDLQNEYVKKRTEDAINDTVLFCTHPPVVTLGRGSKPEDLIGWKGSVYEINRGGRATYHGPSQVVCYPILSLKKERQDSLAFQAQDLRAYLEFLETVIMKTLEHYDLNPQTKSSKPLEPGQLNRGVWVNERKIASIGIAVKKWCTMHGLALNVTEDPQAFTGILGCGFQQKTYTSMEEELSGVQKNSLNYNDVVSVMKDAISTHLKAS